MCKRPRSALQDEAAKVNNSIHVVHVINGLGLGGGERFLLELATHLDSNRFKQSVLCVYEAGELAPLLKSAGVAVHVLNIGRHFRPHGWLQVYRALRCLSADIVHTHLTEACWYGLPSAWLADVPVRIAHLQNCHWHLPLKLRLLDMATSRFSNAFLACSHAVRRYYQLELRYPEAKIHVVHNALDLSRFDSLPDRSSARQMLGAPDDALILVSVASLTEQKGHRYLLEAFATVQRSFPKARMWLVGDGVLRQSLEELAERLEVAASVEFLGKRLDVPVLLAAADVFVLASLWEGMGLVLAEAGAAALPVVATRVDGVPEVTEEGKTGLLVPPQRPDLLAEAMASLLGSEELRQRFGRSALEHVKNTFSIHHAVAEIEKLYESLLAHRLSRRSSAKRRARIGV